ncbi:hypothetical protein B277_13704 [Janibacter hoylei PVAS-1]|nr:DUF262 domain-containing protein [Janibacter hoylei]EKA60220.1 hypothetical protein B277_13704 [Janibacter hoylei PVAS-1]
MPQEHESLKKALDDKTFVIADYQRPYAWTDKQLGDLWGDLDLLGDGEHFAGTLVLRETGHKKTTSAGETLKEYEVVDGQQRLTTVTILMTRLAKALDQIQGVTDEGLADGVLEAKRQIGALVRIQLLGTQEPRLQLGTDLRGFWRDHIIEDLPAPSDPIASARRLLRAATFFDQRLVELVEGAAPEVAAGRLLDLRRRLTSGLQLLVYPIKSTAEVGVIFETLNDRGILLTDLEKIKNYLLYLASQLDDVRRTKLADLINERWSGVFKNLAGLPSDSEDRLLRSHWLATQEPNIRLWERSESIKKKFPRTHYVHGSQRLRDDDAGDRTDPEAMRQRLFDDVSDYVDQLWQCSAFLRDLEGTSTAFASSTADPADIARVSRNSQALVRSGVVAQFLPLLFATRLASPGNAAGYADVLVACETFAARVFAICARRSGAGRQALAGLAHQVFKGSTSIGDAVTRVGSLTWEYAPDSLVRNNLTVETNWYVRSSHKYVLYEYELSKGKTVAVLKPFETFTKNFEKTTEHILPRNPKDIDKASPTYAGSWRDIFSDDERKSHTHSLGNLILTMDNSSYSNKEYVEKRGKTGQTQPPCYFTAALASEREVAEKWPSWTAKAIEERLAALTTWAVSERWPATGPSTSEPTVDDPADDADQAP